MCSWQLTRSRPAPVRANRTLTTLRTVYNWALSCDLVEKEVLRNRARRRASARWPPQLRTLWHDLATVPAVSTLTPKAFGLQLLTACRIGEALGAAKVEIDLERRLWTSPSAVAPDRESFRVLVLAWGPSIRPRTQKLNDHLKSTEPGLQLFQALGVDVETDPTIPEVAPLSAESCT